MFLKRVEIIGFKSFADKIGIDFVPGVTAVVGPNGSGKSNITDAIRWVLGEQSAKSLRGAKMEDVIFAGSDSRKPLNFAEVTLILDNSNGLFPLDYTEISVSRRVFRSGESAYLLNGQQCRLKDINDVFMDSGLGKEAFSIISQGRVDEILNSKPEDRRSIFDEAAGVLKYKTRKRKAEHKLFETSDNLDRVQDIIKELESRIEPLEKSAEAAKKYAHFSEELHEADIILLNFDAGKLRNEIEIQMLDAEKFQQIQNEKSILIEQTESAAIHLKEQLAIIDAELENLQKQLVDASSETEKWEGRRLLSVEKRRNADQQVERIQTELANAQKEKDELLLKISEAQSKRSTLESENQKNVNEIKDISQILNRSVQETENEIEDLKSTYIDMLNEEATVRNDLKHNEERLAGEKSSSEKKSQQTTALKSRLRTLLSDRQSKVDNLSGLHSGKTEAEVNFGKCKKSLDAVEGELTKKQELLQRAHNRQYEMQGRMRALESMEKDFSGFYSGAKEVLLAKNAGNLTGIEGAVAELISVDHQHVKAIETALGGAMQHIVTTTEQEARNAIQHLRGRNAGRATFLPLDVMKSRKIQPHQLQSIQSHPEFIGTADKLVEMEPRFIGISENLLGNVLVATHLEGASAIAKTMQYRYRVVTLDGDVVNAGGSLTGGGAKGQASIFTRKAELETLKEQVNRMAASIKVGVHQIAELKIKVGEQMHALDGARNTLEQIQSEVVSNEASIREMNIEIRSIETEISTVEMDRQGSENTETALTEKEAELKERHKQLTDQLEVIRSQVDTLERLASDRRNEEAALTVRLTDLRERAAALREQIAHQNQSITDMENAIYVIEKRIAIMDEELYYFTGGEDGEELPIEEIEKQIKESIANRDRIEASIQNYREQRLNRVGEVEDNASQLKDLRQAIDKAVTQLHATNVGMSRLEVKYEAVITRLLNEYGLKPNFEMIEDFDEVGTREKVVQLKREIAIIGPVNPGAIEEFAEVSERFEFLTGQRNDLLDAKQTLEEAMSEMDNEMIVRFSATFDAIQHRFRDVFKEMFGGGDADLILTQPNNLLDTGVDIVARPPGKKLQNLSLLSGGERALTAISLLFAIIEVRPVPFCILDEVEAALDEANVVRYSQYLKKFSEKTQFIVITHRKGTMEGADVLYGITMQESGVSKLISVKLSEVPEGAIM